MTEAFAAIDPAKSIVLATRNLGKVLEFERILEAAKIDIAVLGLRDFPDMPDVDETGTTFAENALLKAHQISDYTGLPALADDSGLCVDALGGAPGIFSARWSGVHGNDEANLKKVLSEMKDLGNSDRSARFRCAVALVIPESHPAGAHEIVREGEMTGELVFAPRGANGFGYDPIFQPTGYTQTSAELSSEEKDAISHRAHALHAILPEVTRLIALDAR